MKKFLLNCWDFISSAFIIFIFLICILVALAVCYTFPNVAIVAGLSALAIAFILVICNKK